MKNASPQAARARIETIVLYVVFAFYLLFLAKLLIFSRVSLQDLPGSPHAAQRSVNLIALRSIWGYLLGGSDSIERFAFSNLAGNILAFLPLGACLPLFGRDRRIARNLLWVFVASLLAETIQGVFGIGAADIDDLLLNCLGGLIGILGYRLLLMMLREHKNVRTAFAVLAVLGLPVLLYSLFVIRLQL